MSVQTILFDLDGTLLDTLADLAASTNAALTAFGYPPKSADAVRRAVGSGVRRLMSAVLPGGEENPDFGAVYACFRTHYAAHDHDTTRPYPGICALVSALYRQGAAMAVVSNKPDAAVKSLTRRFFGGQIPVAIGDGAELRRKPFPDSCEKALALLGRGKTGAVYIGDSQTDIATAKNAGLPLICVSWGFRSREELLAAGATRIAADAAALFAYLNEEE